MAGTDKVEMPAFPVSGQGRNPGKARYSDSHRRGSSGDARARSYGSWPQCYNPAMPSYVIAGALVFHRGRFQPLEVRTDGPYIAAVAPSVDRSGATVIDAAGLHLFPGIIDTHVHFREPGRTHKEDLESGSRAAVAGGVTSYLEMPNTEPSATTQALIDEKLALAASKSHANFGFFIGATADNVQELAAARRVCGIKIFMSSSTGSLLVDDPVALDRIFAQTPRQRVIAVHAECEMLMRQNAERLKHRTDFAVHSEVRDAEVAWRATRQAYELAQKHQHRLHVLHCSTARETEFFTPGRSIEAKLITAEVCPHYLLLNTSAYERLGTLAKMNPPLKSEADNRGLWQALHAGAIDCIATDHAPHTLDEKRQDIWKAPSGIPAIENSLALMLDSAARGRCSLEQLAWWMCEAPARAYRLKRKGFIEPGFDADLTLVDTTEVREVRNERQFTRVKWSPWHGQRLTGWPKMTFVRGCKVYDQGTFDEAARGSEIEYA
ncbi:MAG: dihydroorotase [Planctomycetota bacterium]|nr:dihydroorotase [Planctomycetota bacterium]GIK54251.1 MAG: dihydroorotase [Planctomycetota bacterium]